MQKSHWLVLSLAVAFATSSLQAITYIVPSDRDLVRRAEAIAIATPLESHGEISAGGGVMTVAELEIEDVLKGSMSATVRLAEPGGFAGGLATMIPGSPRFEVGKRYLIFLTKRADGEWTTWGLGLGLFAFTNDLHGRELLSRGGDEQVFGFEEKDWTPHVEKLRDASEFLSFVRTVVGNDLAPAREDYFVERSNVVLVSFPEFHPQRNLVPVVNATRPDYLSSGNFRWQNATVTIVYCCASKGLQAGGLNGPTALNAGCNNWTGAGTNARYTAGANDETATGGLAGVGRGFSDLKSAVLFGDPFNDFAAAGVPNGVAGLGGVSKADFQYMFSDGFTYFNTVEGDVIIAKNLSTDQQTFNGVVTHELGHTLGFRHSNQLADNQTSCSGSSVPCTSDAVMNSTVAFDLQNLRPYDMDAVQTVYGSGPVCTPPSITVQPASVTINSGQSTTLSVTASGTAALTYQWYIGSPPTASNPVPGGTSASINVSPTSNTTYWVRVTGQCGSPADSAAATVTVQACVPPSITTQPASSTISSGQSATLTVGASGSGLSYQWYIGSPGTTSNPVQGGNSASISVSPGSTTTYWVRVTGQCAPTVDSAAATITVQCQAPTIVNQPQNQSVISGGTVVLTVGYSGSAPVTITWYQGSAPNTSQPVGTGQTITSPAVAVTTNFWAMLSNACGSANTQTITITVTPCTAPSNITAVASPTSITTGQSVNLQVTVGTGTNPLSFQWFRGQRGNESNPIVGATTFSIVDTPSSTTSYWVKVTNGCGSDSSNTVTVTVTVPGQCTAVSITTNPASQTVVIGTSATLGVAANGSAPVHYQWYQGTAPVATKPVGTDSATFTTPAINIVTSFWVKVTNDCGTASSTTAVVSMKPGRPRAAHH